jgi:hypothetical protein
MAHLHNDELVILERFSQYLLAGRSLRGVTGVSVTFAPRIPTAPLLQRGETQSGLGCEPLRRGRSARLTIRAVNESASIIGWIIARKAEPFQDLIEHRVGGWRASWACAALGRL